MDKTISVIIPCYNYAQYLKECIDSVLAQTYLAHEVIVVSDGSPDIEEMKKVLAGYTDYRITLIEKPNGGLSSARNFGIEQAKGNYIMCLDADDKLIPGALEEHVKLLSNDKSIAQCALMEFGERHVINVPPETTTLERVMQANTIYCNALFPKQAWVDIGGFDESETMRLGYEDWEAWIRMLAMGYHVNTSDFIALRYRCHEGQMTQATSHPNRQILYKYIYEKHKNLYDERNLSIAGLIK